MISPAEAAEAAAAFRRSGKANIAGSRTAADLTLAYTEEAAGQPCFYIFNAPDQGGYTIVAADDRVDGILGYSESGEFNPHDIPDNMRWWLSTYRRDISVLNKSGKAAVKAKVPQHKLVKPLIQTKWNQDTPFNDLCPNDSVTGKRSVTGCVATAMAQVMKFHNWPPKGKGSFEDYSFEGTKYDWDNMLDVYTADKYSVTEANAVARLMLDCGKSVNMKYSSEASGAQSAMVGLALMDYFDYDPSLRMHRREAYTTLQWDSLVYNELASGRPVYYSGASENGGHAFVCDGYQGNGFFHFNWGWGGSQDGYFRLYCLDPAAGGIGSYEGGYNNRQQVFTHVIPNTGIPCERQVLLVATGGYIGHVATEKGVANLLIRFNDADGKQSGAYNYLAYTEKIAICARWEAADNPGKYWYSKNYNAELKSNYGYTGFTTEVPEAPDGNYKVQLLYRGIGSQEPWQVVNGAYGLSQYATATISNGVLVSAGEEEIPDKSDIIVNKVEWPAEDIQAEITQKINLTLSNVGETDCLRKKIGIYSSQENGTDEQPKLLCSSGIVLPAGYSDQLNLQTAIPQSGDVRINIVEFTDSGRRILPGGDFTIHVTEPGQFSDPTGLSIGSVSPSFANNTSPVTVEISRNGYVSDAEATNAYIQIRLINASTGAVVMKKSYKAAYFTSGTTTRRFNYGSIADVKPGDYLWQLVLSQNNGKQETEISRKFPVRIYSGPYADSDNAITYELSPSGAEITSVDNFMPEGDVSIPANVGVHTVTSLAPDLFTFASGITSISIPGNVGINTGQFYLASALQRIDVRGSEPAFMSAEAFAPGAAQTVELTVDNGAANIYKRTPGWDLLKMGSWTITVGAGVRIDSGLDIDPATSSIYRPYFVNPEEQLSVNFTSTTSEMPKIIYTIGEGSPVELNPVGSSFTLPALHGECGKLSIGDTSGVETGITDELSATDVYTVTGILAGRGLTKEQIVRLPAGIYVANGKKIVVH